MAWLHVCSMQEAGGLLPPRPALLYLLGNRNAEQAGQVNQIQVDLFLL